MRRKVKNIFKDINFQNKLTNNMKKIVRERRI